MYEGSGRVRENAPVTPENASPHPVGDYQDLVDEAIDMLLDHTSRSTATHKGD